MICYEDFSMISTERLHMRKWWKLMLKERHYPLDKNKGNTKGENEGSILEDITIGKPNTE